MNHPKIIPADQPDEPPIAAAARLTIDLDTAADDHPALSAEDLRVITGRILQVPNDLPEISADMHRLIDYIRYLERLRCDGCGSPLGYHNYAGHTLCGPCANGAVPEPERVTGRGIAFMAKVPTLNRGTVRVSDSSDAENDALWLVIGRALIEETTVNGNELQNTGSPAASTTLDIRDAMELARQILALAERRGYTYSDDSEENQPEDAAPDPTAPEPVIVPVPVPGPYPADVIDALTETAGWASRWAFEHRRAEDLNEQLGWVESVHYPYETPGDPHVKRRCRGCIAGYDPRTGQLLNAAWPCATERAKNGER
jgi:hypothetical protein